VGNETRISCPHRRTLLEFIDSTIFSKSVMTCLAQLKLYVPKTKGPIDEIYSIWLGIMALRKWLPRPDVISYSQCVKRESLYALNQTQVHPICSTRALLVCHFQYHSLRQCWCCEMCCESTGRIPQLSSIQIISLGV
jgi:hypothetical protein